MTTPTRRSIARLVLAVAFLGLGVAASWGQAKPEDEALSRAREQVRMLDDLYKNAVVSITQVYKDGPPAARVAKQVFGAMEKAGHHSARLVDATGNPLNEANAPESEFEKRAAKAMREGKKSYEEIVDEGGQRRLLTATIVPAVLPRCATCHAVNEGDLLGFIRYDLPVK